MSFTIVVYDVNIRIYIYIYIYIYTHTHTHTHIYIYTHTHTHIYILIMPHNGMASVKVRNLSPVKTYSEQRTTALNVLYFLLANIKTAIENTPQQTLFK